MTPLEEAQRITSQTDNLLHRIYLNYYKVTHEQYPLGGGTCSEGEFTTLIQYLVRSKILHSIIETIIKQEYTPQLSSIDISSNKNQSAVTKINHPKLRVKINERRATSKTSDQNS